MYRYHVRYCPSVDERLPRNCRPLLRYRKEYFGFLAAFPHGRVMLLNDFAGPLLERGASMEELEPTLLTSLSVATDFHFSAPLMVWLEITRQCNLRCRHCFVEGGAKRAWELPTGRILQLLDELAEMGAFALIITGGEPTLHPDFIDIVQHAHKSGFVIGIATNGVPLTKRMLDCIPREDVIISMSIDGLHGQEGARRQSDFDFVTKKLLAVRDRGFDVNIMTTTTHENADDLQKIISWAIENDVSLRSVPFVVSGRGTLHPQLLNRPADVNKVAQFWLEEEKWERAKDPDLGLCVGKVFNFLHTMTFATQRCMSGRGSCYVSAAGDVYPCTTCAGQKILCAGNIRFAPFRDIWNGDAWDIRQITWKTFEDVCRNCPINDEKYFCSGRCPGSSSVLNNRRFDRCGTTEFQRLSILQREQLFRENVREEPRVLVHGAAAQPASAKRPEYRSGGLTSEVE